MTDRKPGRLTPVGTLIADSMEEGFLGLAREMVRVFEVWPEAVGPYNASKASPESIKNGRLTVVVESSVWIDHFGYLKDEFIEAINKALGAPMVEELVFRVGKLPQKGSPAYPVRTPSRPKINPAPSPGNIEAAVAPVKDQDLKEALASLLARQEGDRSK